MCRVSSLAALNSCAVMKEHFSCAECDENMGSDQPAYVNPQSSLEVRDRGGDVWYGV